MCGSLCRRGHHPSILPCHTLKREPFFDQLGNRSAISKSTGSLQKGTPAGALENLWVATLRGPLAWGGLLGSRAPGVSPGSTGKPPGSPGAPGNLPLQSYLGTPGGPGPTAQRGVPSTAKCSKSLSYAITYTMTILKKVQSIHYS